MTEKSKIVEIQLTGINIVINVYVLVCLLNTLGFTKYSFSCEIYIKFSTYKTGYI